MKFRLEMSSWDVTPSFWRLIELKALSFGLKF
jgi:hypothetical protein